MSREESVLAPFGISAEAEAVWRALIAHPSAELKQIRKLTNSNDEQLTAAIDVLLDQRLIRRSDVPAGVVAVDPALAVETHIIRAERSLAQTAETLTALRAQLPTLADEYTRARTAAGHQPGFEILVSFEEIRRQIYLVAERSQSNSRSLLYQPSIHGVQDANPLDLELLQRGVQLQSIVATSDLADPDLYAEFRLRHSHGEQIRSVTHVPGGLLILDRELAVVSLDLSNLAAGAMFIRVQGLVDLLIHLYDALWEQATGVFEITSHPTAPTGRPAQVLELLAGGAKDASIARTLGVGVRTVRRDISELQDALGVNSRAAALVAATRRNWL